MKVKQIIALVIVVALLMTGSVLVTMAYLTDTQTVTNTFTIGNVKIVLNEAWVNAKGEALNEAGEVVQDIAEAKRVTENGYQLMPGRIYTKDPTVKVMAGSEQSYIRMIVTITEYAELCAAYGKEVGALALTDLILNGAEGLGAGWEFATQNGGEFEYRFNTVADENTEIPALFTQIQLSGDVSTSALEKLDGMKIEVVAHAIQAEGLANAVAAWDAFDQTINPTTVVSETPVGGQ